MDFRHEWKHIINYSDMITIRQRMRAVAKADVHAENGKYLIRSLYFDNLNDKALMEKINGINIREKFRIRYYNGNTSVIHLEKKSKYNSLGTKHSADLTAEEAQMIADGNIDWMIKADDRPLIQELYTKMITQGLKPKTIVDYTREPFTYSAGNVRVTLDYDIRTGMQSTDFLNPDCITVPVADNPIILEVKWDEFLPSVIRDAVMLESRRTTGYSKYEACRIYG